MAYGLGAANVPNLLFISDIRTANWQKLSNEEVEEAVQEDMQAQRRWHNLLKPNFSMLKFRLSWNNSIEEYLDGEVYLPVWGPQTTTESRLVVAGRNDKQPLTHWDNQRYEHQMFYFNTVTRVQTYQHQVDAEGIDHCFDCASEVDILRSYLEKHHRPWLQTGQGPDPLESIQAMADKRQACERNWLMKDGHESKSSSAFDPMPSAASASNATVESSSAPSARPESNTTPIVEQAPSAHLDAELMASNKQAKKRSSASFSSSSDASCNHASADSSLSKRTRQDNQDSSHNRRRPQDPTYDPTARDNPFPNARAEDSEPEYLKRLLSCIGRLSEMISRACSTSRRTLTTVLPPPERRRRHQGVF